MSKKLRSEFTFGFEFEGFGRLETYLKGTDAYYHYDEDFDYMDCNCLDGDDYDDYYNSINRFINGKLYAKSGRTHYDGSVKNYLNGYQSFEYSSPVYKVNMRNFKKLNNFFSHLKDYDMGINETCGFHVHISFKDITEKDAIWIVSQIACNEDWTNEIIKMTDGDQIIDFYSQRYADKEFLKNLKENILYGRNDIRNIVNCEKYRVLRIHPQGTLEWRGPRNFLNIENGFMKFAKKLTKVIDIFSKALEMKKIAGISKEEFFNSIILKEPYNFNGFSLNPSLNKTLKRHDKLMLAQDFNLNTITNQKNITNWGVLHKISESCDRNPNILFNKDLQQVIEPILNNISRNAAKKFIALANKNKIQLNKNIVTTILMKYSDILPYVAHYFSKMSLEEIMFYIDRTNFGHLNNEDKEEFVNTLIKNIDKSYIIDVTNSLLLSDFSTFKSIVKLMKEGYYKGLNCSRIYNLYEKLQPYISYESESAENIFKPLKTNDLISYDLNSIESLKLNSSIINDLISNLDVNFNNAITIDTSTEYFRDEECRIETQPCNVNVYLVE